MCKKEENPLVNYYVAYTKNFFSLPSKERIAIYFLIYYTVS